MSHLPKEALQNNIGALMLLKNETSAAKERFYAAILTKKNWLRCSSLADLIPDTMCPKVDVEPSGLIWFEKRLYKETLQCSHRNDVLDTILPFGMEYFQYPIRVTSSCDARIAAGINLALVLLRESKHNFEDIIRLLKWAIGLDFEDTHDEVENENIDQLLIAIAHSNIGVIRFMQHNLKAAVQNLSKATSILSDAIQNSQRHPRNPWSVINTPIDYVKLTIMMNHVHLAIRTNDDHTRKYYDSLLSAMNSLSYKSFYRIKWLIAVSTFFIKGLINQSEEHFSEAFECYNKMLHITRKEWGHNHKHVAKLLEHKGTVQFDQKKYQNAMLSYLASWKIYQHAGCTLDESRLLYAIGRTLHDREEFSDALGMYQKSIALRETIDCSSKKMKVDAIEILCNICRVQRIMGDLPNALETNLRVVQLASEMVGGSEAASSHAFIRNRMMILGNLYVEMGQLPEAMEIFSQVARGNGDGNSMIISHARPELEDVDTNSFTVRAAERLGKLGTLKPHAAAA